MTAPAAAYAAPNIPVTAIGSTNTVQQAPGGKVVGLIGTAPIGPDWVEYNTPASFAQRYGDPASVSAKGHTMPVAGRLVGQQKQKQRNQGVTIASLRSGVTRASIVLKETDGTTAVCTVQGVGMYAGSKGNNLQVVVTASNVAIVDTVLNTTLRLYPVALFPSGTMTGADVQTVINGDNPYGNPSSVVTVSNVAAPSGLLGSGSFTLTGGADGKGTTATDPSIAAILAQSMAVHIDYLVPLWDLASVYSAVGAHTASAAAGNEWRKVIGGPAANTSYSTLTGSYNTFNSGAVACAGHDIMNGKDLYTNGFAQYEGWMIGAMLAGMKAVGPTEETADDMALSGVNQVLSTGKTGYLWDSDLDPLGKAGFVALKSDYSSTIPIIRDFTSTMPQYDANNVLSYYQQFSTQDVEDAVKTQAYLAARAYRGRPRGREQQSLVRNIVRTALANLERQKTINGFSVDCAYDTNGVLQTGITFALPYPNMSLPITVGFTV